MHAISFTKKLTQIDMSNRMPTYAIPNKTPIDDAVHPKKNQKKKHKNKKNQKQQKPERVHDKFVSCLSPQKFVLIHFTQLIKQLINEQFS